MQIKFVFKTLISSLLLACFIAKATAQGNDYGEDVMSMFDGDTKDIWIHNYIGTLNNTHQIKMSLGNDGNVYKGIYRYQSSGVYFYLEGKFNGNILELQEINSSDYTTGYLLLKKEKNAWVGEWRNLDQSLILPLRFYHENLVKQQVVSTSSEETNLYEYADFDIRIEWTYPKLRNRAFKEWILKKITNWKQNIRTEIRQNKKEDPGLTVKDRFKYEALAWTEVTCSTDRLISGRLLYQRSWTSAVITNTFLFDLEKDKEIKIESLYKEALNSNQIVLEAIEKNVSKINMEENQLIKSWISNASFQHFSMGHTGLVISTDFNTIFGSKEIVIPYRDLKDSLKKSGLIKSLRK